jgi:hypothetical protein
MVSMTFNVSCDHESLDQAARALAAIKATLPPADEAGPAAVPVPPPEPSAPAGAAAKPEDFVEKWLKRLGPGSRGFWKKAAEYATGPVLFITFEDLEKATGVKMATLRSYHRNSYRAIKDEGAPDPMPGTWSAATKRYEYAMFPAVRDKILELTTDDPA